MTGRAWLWRATLVMLLACAMAAALVLVTGIVRSPIRITAMFTTATGVYPGDQVRVAGVEVGQIETIDADGAVVRLSMTVDHAVPIPADAQAVIVAQNLISARYVQLTPSYRGPGPTLGDGAEIPVTRTAVPVEWDEVKRQITRLATELGPTVGAEGTSVSRFIDSTAAAMGDNGEKLRETLRQLSGVGRVLAQGGGNIVDIIANLQTFITTLRDSNTQIVQFQDRLATLTSVLEGSRSDLDAALTNVADVVADVQRFIAGTRDKTAEQIRGLADVTQNLVDHRRDLEQLLHMAPTGLANTYNFFDPRDGSINGAFAFNNFANPVALICSALGAVENTTAPETAKLCAQYLGPGLRLLNFNGLPFPVNPVISAMPPPELMRYTDASLAPGGAGPAPQPPETPPSVSAFTGMGGDVIAPPQATSFPEMMLPSTTLAPQPPGPLLPAEGPPRAMPPTSTPEGTPAP
ncbi:MCE family protein [Mycobacterium sp. 236(2023)]|uniref:MCE family protein n=1 Tax=Mycobacterium sp. 236(2023) TaxID=3038163 RepID=UPI00241505D1|nr:MCE family protein [Mycobacterium sp. 236(2023)]MDG4668180.1 MCE family protein [Mycobacterium sp. 236(2023)]